MLNMAYNIASLLICILKDVLNIWLKRLNLGIVALLGKAE